MKHFTGRIGLFAALALAACGTGGEDLGTEPTTAGQIAELAAASAPTGPAAVTPTGAPTAAAQIVGTEDEEDEVDDAAASAPEVVVDEPAPTVAAAPAASGPPDPSTITPGQTITYTSDSLLCNGCTFTYETFATTRVTYKFEGVTSSGRALLGNIDVTFSSKGSGYGGFSSAEGGGYASLLAVTKGSKYTILVRNSAGSGTNPDAGLFLESLDATVVDNGNLQGTFRLPQSRETGTFKARISSVKEVIGYR